MIGWDFSVFWQIGQVMLSGGNPYTVEFSRYPPAAGFFFAAFALLPFEVSFAVWSGMNVVLYLYGLRRMGLGRRAWGWLLFTPFLFNLLTGQMDIIFWWAALYLLKNTAGENWHDWRPALAGAFITLKPQLAMVVLPWYLWRWLRSERGLLLRWAGLSAVLHALPLLLYGTQIYMHWLAALSGVSEMKMGVSAGVFAFGLWNLPIELLAGLGLALMVWGWFQPEPASRAAQLCGFPLTIWYDNVLLAGNGPVWLMVPLSWLAFLGAVLVQNSLPLVAIPVGALAWQVWQRRVSKTAGQGFV